MALKKVPGQNAAKSFTNSIPKEMEADNLKNKVAKKNNAGRKKLGNEIAVSITENQIKIKKITKQIAKKKVSFSLSKECLDILNKRGKEAGIPVSQIIEIAVKAFDEKVVIE